MLVPDKGSRKRPPSDAALVASLLQGQVLLRPSFVELPLATNIVQVALSQRSRAAFNHLRAAQTDIWRGDSFDVYSLAEALPLDNGTTALLRRFLRSAVLHRSAGMQALMRLLLTERVRRESDDAGIDVITRIRRAETGVASARQALIVAARTKDLRVTLTAAGYLSDQLGRNGDRAQAREVMERVVATAQTAGLHLVGPYLSLGSIARHEGRFEDADRLTRAGYESARMDETVTYQLFAVMELIELNSAADRPEEVMRWSREAEQVAAKIASEWASMEVFNARLKSIAALRTRGRLREAESNARTLLSQVEAARPPLSSDLCAEAHGELGRALLAQGRTAAAINEFMAGGIGNMASRAHFATEESIPDLSSTGSPIAAGLLNEAAEAAAAVGDSDAAEVYRSMAFMANPSDMHALYMRRAIDDDYASELARTAKEQERDESYADYKHIDEVISASSSAEQTVAAREGLIRRLVVEGRFDEAESLARQSAAQHPLDPAWLSPLAVRAHLMLAWTLSHRPEGAGRAREVIAETAGKLSSAVRGALLPARRSELVGQWQEVFSLAVRLLAGSSQPMFQDDVDLAFTLHEAAKSQTFLAELASGSMPAPAGVSPSLLATEAALLAQKRRLLSEHDGDESVLLPRLTELQSELEWCWAAIEMIAPTYTRTRRAESVDVDLSRSLLASFAGLALWSFFVSDDETTCFVLKPRKPVHIVVLPLGRAAIGNAVRALRVAFNGDYSSLFAVPPIDPDAPHTADTKLRPFREVCDALSVLAEHLPETELLIAPHGPLHGFPFAALPLPDGRTLGAAAPLTYTPSLSVLSLELSRSPALESPLRVDAYSVACAEDKDHAAFELVDDVFAPDVPITHTVGLRASKQAVLIALASAQILHLTCHGFVDSVDPLESGLLLSDGTRRPPRSPGPHERDSFVLTAREILNTTSNCRLVSLRACSSGVQQERNRGDEFEGLIRALLYSGVARVVVSLWNVDRDSSGETFRVFYRQWLGGTGSAASALHVAQQTITLYTDVRSAWQHLYHWAPFVCLGDLR
jgi:tetratricopeptide (TPR) repeat protein